ncbi:MAG TPA: class I SAM-dependent methyltransferase [Dehalococcoidia bacterium]|nr:class I SAM-dependent methyltransferase [Dehalococcoidia bacterium]
MQLGISGYTNYRWLPELTIPLCERLVQHLSISVEDKILDFGCAKGYLVQAFTQLGYDCRGLDVSEYAIACADSQIKDRLRLQDGNTSVVSLFGCHFDCIIAKDVLEHVPYEELDSTLAGIRDATDCLFCAIPLGADGKYVVPEYETDITHIVREDLAWWCAKIRKAGFAIQTAAYRVPGIKDNWSHYAKGNGFISAQ